MLNQSNQESHATFGGDFGEKTTAFKSKDKEINKILPDSEQEEYDQKADVSIINEIAKPDGSQIDLTKNIEKGDTSPRGDTSKRNRIMSAKGNISKIKKLVTNDSNTNQAKGYTEDDHINSHSSRKLSSSRNMYKGPSIEDPEYKEDKLDEKKRPSQIIINNNIVNAKGGKNGTQVVTINNNIMNMDSDDQSEVVINNNMIFNPYKAKEKHCVTGSEQELPDANQSKLTNEADKLLNDSKINVPKRKVISFGIHTGWCFENVLGSIYKCNPYFSGSHVEIASLYQRINDIYDTSLIFGQETYRYLPECIKFHTKQIDQV